MHLHLPSLVIGALLGFAFGYFILRWVTMVKTDAGKLAGEFNTAEAQVKATFDTALDRSKVDPPSTPSTKT
jgi:hypothetical protein